jgi:hypothetical protein
MTFQNLSEKPSSGLQKLSQPEVQKLPQPEAGNTQKEKLPKTPANWKHHYLCP